jgi:hypothetical protein
MPSGEDPLDEIRNELLRLLAADDWQVTDSARTTAFPLLRAAGLMPTDATIIDYVTRLLEEGRKFHEVPLGTEEKATS